MVDFSGNFQEFLKRYNSDAYQKIKDDKTPEEVLNRIYNEYVSTFETWEKIPQILRDRYGIVPQDIMDAASRGEIYTLREMEYDPSLKTAADARAQVDQKRYAMAEDIVVPAAAAVFTAAVVAGYSAEAANELARNRQFRESLKERAASGSLTPEEKTLWHQSREKDAETIKKDWIKNQPEKMLIHLFTKLNRHPERKDKYLSQIADLIQKIETENRQDKLLKYLERPIVQAKLSRFKPEILDLLNDSLLKNVPTDMREGYLANAVPLKLKLTQLIDADNKGTIVNLQDKVNNLVKEAKQNEIGLDFKNYTAISSHPMSAELRQRLMIACCINNVAYRAPIGDKINLSSDYFKSLPADIQTLVASKEMGLRKKRLLDHGRALAVKETYSNMPSVLMKQQANSR